jgi:hypothetical protein
MELFEWYWDDLLPAVAGNIYWREGIRHFMTISMANHKNKMCIPCSTEAMCVLIYENCVDKWVAIFNFKEGERGKKIPKKKDDPLSSQFKAKYSDAASGQAKYGGWSNQGLLRFNTIKDKIKEGREEEHVPALEVAMLQHLKKKHGKPEDTAEDARKKRKRKRQSEELVEEAEKVVIELDEE